MSEATATRPAIPKRRRKAAPVGDGAALTLDVPGLKRRLIAMKTQLEGSFFEREDAIMAIMLSMVGGFNYLLVGPPGTAKTALIRAVVTHIRGARFFDAGTLNAFTSRDELVGGYDLPALMQGVQRRKTQGKLPSVEIANIDEIFKCSDGALNSLLNPFNERTFEGAHTPLWMIGSASNWPEVERRGEKLEAFWDRITIRVSVDKLSGKTNRRKALRSAQKMRRAPYHADEDAMIEVDELRMLNRWLQDNIAFTEDAEEMLLAVQDRLDTAKIQVSDRRLEHISLVMRCHAWLNGRAGVGVDDFAYVTWCVWNRKQDIAEAAAICKDCDREYKQKLIKIINDARLQHAEFTNLGWNIERAQVFIELAGDAVEKLVVARETTPLSKQSAIDLNTACTDFERVVEDVLQEWGSKLGVEAE